jgi:hypothetical protein
MTATLRRAGDRVLGKFMPSADAGACVPDHGDLCTSCTCRVESGRVVCYRNRVSCYGQCARSSGYCN